MSALDFMLGFGNEAFEDREETEEVVSTAPAVSAEEVAEMIADRDIARAQTDIVAVDAEIAQEQRVIAEHVEQIERIESVQASMEYFVDNGFSDKTAKMLQDQLVTTYARMGKGLESFGGGLEGLANGEELTSAMLSAGLLALDGEKEGLGKRLAAGAKRLMEMIKKFFEHIFDQTARVKASAMGVINKAKEAKEAKEVSYGGRDFVIKGGKISENVPADFKAFATFITTAVDKVASDRIAALDTIVAQANKIGDAKSVADACSSLRALPWVEYPGTRFMVAKKGDVTIMRTEVVLGGYAVFEQFATAPVAKDVETAKAHIRAQGRSSLSIRRANGEKAEAVKKSLTPAQASDMAKEVIKLMDTVSGMKSNVVNKLTTVMGGFINGKKIKGYVEKNGTNEGDAKDVAKIAEAFGRYIIDYSNGVGALPKDAAAAAVAVSNAVLGLAKKVVGGKDEKDEKDEKGDKPKEEEKAA